MRHDPANELSPLAGKPAPKSVLVDLASLERDYYRRKPELSDPAQLVSFGTSGHRGSSLRGSFNEAHIAAITQAICDYRRAHGIDGPLHMGKDTHGLSEPAQRTALEVLAANDVDTILQRDAGVTPTPVISWAVLAYNRRRKAHLADGIVITPSHNPPEDGGFKYDTPNGGPADVEVTAWIQDRANELLRAGNTGVKRTPFATALNRSTTHHQDFVLDYVRDLGSVVDLELIREAGLELGVDPLGGASKPVWEAIAEVHVRRRRGESRHRPTFSFMTMVTTARSEDPSVPMRWRGSCHQNRFRVIVANVPMRTGTVSSRAGL
jgi:phosphoglucomutase